MSRIGRLPIEIPAGVTVEISSENQVTVKGPLGTLTQEITGKITVEKNENTVVVTRQNEEKETRAKHGLYRALIANMIEGVTKGF